MSEVNFHGWALYPTWPPEIIVSAGDFSTSLMCNAAFLQLPTAFSSNFASAEYIFSNIWEEDTWSPLVLIANQIDVRYLLETRPLIQPAWIAWVCESCFISLVLTLLVFAYLCSPLLYLVTVPFWTLLVLIGPYWASLGLTRPYSIFSKKIFSPKIFLKKRCIIIIIGYIFATLIS